MAKKKNKYYVVREGNTIWIFNNRSDCEEAVKWFAWAKYKGFTNEDDAQLAFSVTHKKYKDSQKQENISESDLPFEKNSIAVDAACSGNPWVMEYRGVDLTTGQQIFHKKFTTGTNNIGEFLALVHGLSYLKGKKSNMAIYSDSRIAMNRIPQKKCKTKLTINKESQELFDVIQRAILRLKDNTFTRKILKRDTENRGEIPADFGRK